MSINAIRPARIEGIDTVPVRLQAKPRLIHRVDSAIQVERLNATGGVPVNLEGLPNSEVHITFDGSQTETLSIWSTHARHGFLSRPKISADLIAIRFVETGCLFRNDVGGGDAAVSFGQALYAPFDRMQRQEASAGFSAIAATVSRDAVIRATQLLSGSDTVTMPEFQPVVDPRTSGLIALRHTLNVLRHKLLLVDERELTVPLLEELLVYQFVSAWPTIGGQVPSGSPETSVRPVRLAVDFIEGHLDRKIRIADIAIAAGLSVRALQIAFKRHMGCSPVHYLISRRLDRVHTVLATQNVAAIAPLALSKGFSHMSDFSRRYRDRFGHSPSHDLSRRRGPWT